MVDETPKTSITLQAVQDAGEDFEWYPTTQRMIDVVKRQMPDRFGSIMDIGAGDGRVLVELAKRSDTSAKLYAIEKSTVLVQAQPEDVIPVGTDLFEQNLACLPVDYIFCNPPYSQFDAWVCNIIESGYAKKAFLVIPRRWQDSKTIKASIDRRHAKVRIIHSDDFLDADRRARAVVDIVEVSYPKKADRYYHDAEPQDPFDQWFDQNINTFDVEQEVAEDEAGSDIAKKHKLDSIGDMVDAFNEEYSRMEENYRAIFKLDYAILKELQVSKDSVREGIKKRMAGLKTKYWQLLFERLDGITSRLSTETKKRFVQKLTARTSVAFTASNAYAVVLWAIKNANRYYDEQLVKLFRDLSTFDGALKYKSNVKTWEKGDWRFSMKDQSHHALHSRIVVSRFRAIDLDWDGNPRTCLHDSASELIADVIAVMSNLGFGLGHNVPTHARQWVSNVSQAYYGADEEPLFEVKAFKNGNLHFKFKVEAIRALNIEAGRLLGWIKDKSGVVSELGYTSTDADRYYGSSRKITPSSVRLLGVSQAEASAA